MAHQSGELAQVAGQLEINKAEAPSPNPFTSGCRPFIGWTYCAGFAVQFVAGPVGEWVCALAGHPVKFPQMGLGSMMPLLFGMLGLGAYRTAEKVKGALFPLSVLCLPVDQQQATPSIHAGLRAVSAG
jgi:hypothetical protein